MTQNQRRTFMPFLMLGMFLLLTGMGVTVTPSPSNATASPIPLREAPPVEKAEDPEEAAEETAAKDPETESEEDTSAAGAVAPPGARWKEYPNVCETFTVIEGDTRVKNRDGKLVYPVRYKRNRFKRTRRDQRRTRKLIRMVAREMGADAAGQYLVDMMAHHESSWNAEAIHILNPDLSANLEAWERHSYDPGREAEILEELERTSAKTKKFWKLKAKLADLRMYKGNPFWNVQLEYTHKVPERTLHGETTEAFEVTESRSVWAYGYGLYGMNAVLFTHVFDSEAPPWILCGDEGIVATVTAIWALREHQSDCAYLTDKNPEKYGPDGGNARGILRRFARGHCSDSRLGKAWRHLMALDDYDRHIDWDEAPDLGDKFPKYEMYKRNRKWRYRYATEKDPETGETKTDPETGKPIYKRDGFGRRIKIPTDRQEILAHMRKKAEEEGLLRSEPLERKKPAHKPVIVASRASAPSAGAAP